MNVTEISKLPDGMPVVNFQCRVVSTYPPKHGQGQYGPWSMMNMIVEDEQENKISVTWSDEKEISVFPANHNELRGEVIVISARMNQKKQMSGAKKGSYDGKPQVSVTGRCLTRSGRPTQPVGHNDPAWMDGLTQSTSPTAGNANPTKAEAPKMNTTMQPKEKLTVQSVLTLTNFLMQEVNTMYRSCVAPRVVTDEVEAMILDKTGQAVVTMLMAAFRGELHATNQSIEELCGGPDPFGEAARFGPGHVVE